MVEANLTELTADIVANYVRAHRVALDDIAALVTTVYAALASAESGAVEAPEPEAPKPTPAEIRRSVHPDYLVSFIDGSKHKLPRRHLTACGYTPAHYKAKFGLPPDYPAVCPNYSKVRVHLAKEMGLGRRGTGAQSKMAARA